MSWQAVKYVMTHSRATGSQRLVLLALAESAQQPGEPHAWCTWRKPEHYAAAAAVSTRTAQECLHALAGYGKRALEVPEIEIVEHGAPANSIRPQCRPNLYRILVTGGAEVAGAEVAGAGLAVQLARSSGAESDRKPISSGATKQASSQVAVLHTSLESSLETSWAQQQNVVTVTVDSFVVSEALKQWAQQHARHLDLARETAKFRDHHRAKGSTPKDWDASWRLWMTRAAEWQKPHEDEGHVYHGVRHQPGVAVGASRLCHDCDVQYGVDRSVSDCPHGGAHPAKPKARLAVVLPGET